MTLEYRLMKGDVLLGELFDQTVDMPWCEFVPTPAFETVRALFDAGNTEELGRQGVRFRDADTGESLKFLPRYELRMSLNVCGGKAWFSNI